MQKTTIIKLVRDLIPEMCKQKNLAATFYTADKKEYRKCLREKLVEEVTEYLQDNNLEELADIIEVVHALAKEQGFSIEQLEEVRKQKTAKRGAFEKRLVIQYEK